MADESFKPSRSPGDRIGNYVIIRLLGRGGLSEVYLARNVVSEKRLVAIKVLARRFQERPDLRKRLAREADIYDELRHDNIVRMHDIGLLDDGTVYMIMDLIRGRTLREHLALGPLDLRGALHIMIGVTSAMCFAHRKGVIHRDLKPENVMVTPDAEVKVLDFGIAKFSQGGEDSSEMPKLGTIGFLAPEQIGKGPVDGRADIYALGVIFYIVLGEGQHPFENDDGETSDAEMIARHLHAQPRPLDDCPPSAWLIVAKCLAKDPEDRYHTMDDLLEDLSALIHESVPPEDPLAKRAIEEQEIKRASGVQFIAGKGDAAALQGTEPLVSFVAPAYVLPFGHHVVPSSAMPPGGKGHIQATPVSNTETTSVTSSRRVTVLPDGMGPARSETAPEGDGGSQPSAPGAVNVSTLELSQVPPDPSPPAGAPPAAGAGSVPTPADAPLVESAVPALAVVAGAASTPGGAALPAVAAAAGQVQPAFSPARTDLTPSSSEAGNSAPTGINKRSEPMQQYPVHVQSATASNRSIVLMGIATGLTLAVMVASLPGFRAAVRAGAPQAEAAAVAPPAASPAPQVPANDGAAPVAAESTVDEVPTAAPSAVPTGTAEAAPLPPPTPSAEPSSVARPEPRVPRATPPAPPTSTVNAQAGARSTPPAAPPATSRRAEMARGQAPATSSTPSAALPQAPAPPPPPPPTQAPHRVFGSEG